MDILSVRATGRREEGRKADVGGSVDGEKRK